MIGRARRGRPIVAALFAAALLCAAAGCGGGGNASASQAARSASTAAGGGVAPAGTAPSATSTPQARPRAFGVGVAIVHLHDDSRRITLPGGESEPRPLLTIVRYPTVAGRPARAYGPFPLIVFGHGFAVTPAIYAHLLRRWTEAGYVVAAPVFPLGNEHAPGGPYEPDLVNQPADVSFVITRMLAASTASSGPLAGLIDPGEIVAAGQSDGGDTALAVSYDPRYRDRRVDAAVVLSGAEIPYIAPIRYPAGGPPLLATQGTADTVNPPSLTEAFFAPAPRPKFLLWLTGAEHLPPYTDGQPQLGIVERVSLAFMALYVRHRPVTLAKLASLGDVPGLATFEAEP